MPTTLAGRKKEILRLLKENYELKQKIEELEKKIAEATAKTETAETVEKNETAETANCLSAE
jgi:cell division septum initiation protein DivIVA